MTSPKNATTGSILDIPADRYHADEIADQPTLSASIAHILSTATPLHAFTAHPKLNPDFEREEDQKFSVGTAVHALLLQGENVVEVCPFDDWRKNDAKEARDAARAAGRIPLLTKEWERVCAMAEVVVGKLAALEVSPPVFTDGKPEQTLTWTEDNGVICRARLDWLRDDYIAIDDLKTTSASGNPERWGRTMYGIGGDVQVAFYLRGLERVTGKRATFRYVVCETYPPYEVAVVDLMPAALAVGEAKVESAIRTWRRCLDTGVWPGYARRVHSVELPTYEEMRWLEREAREEQAA